jgi:hypothetical protein
MLNCSPFSSSSRNPVAALQTLRSAITGIPRHLVRWTAAIALLLASTPLQSAPELRSDSSTCDTLVYGGTPGGIMAAIAAAREGMKVVLVEPTRHVGGMLSGGLNATDLKKASAIGGLEKEFYERTARHYREKYGPGSEQLTATIFYATADDGKTLLRIPGVKAEPHVCELLFEEMLAVERNISVRKELRLLRTEMENGRIKRCVFKKAAGGGETSIGSRMYIDATYCGDLMAAAGAESRIGVEAKSEYGESMAPVRAAKEVQAYNYRITLTCDPADRVPIGKPDNYDTSNLDFEWALSREAPGRYAEILRNARTTPPSKHSHWNVLPNRKFDANLLPYHGVNWDYPEGDAKRRQEIERAHRDFYLSYLYFVQHDERIPAEAREEYLHWGLCADEFTDNGHFPNQLYVREGRRLIGEYVMAQSDVESNLRKPDSVGIGDYSFDSKGTRVTRDENGKFTWQYSFEKHLSSAYEIPFRSLAPKRNQVANLLVPVCLSSSQIAWSSLRMEPVFMRMGQAAGIAAAIAVRAGGAVQDVEPQELRAKLVQAGAVVDLDRVSY